MSQFSLLRNAGINAEFFFHAKETALDPKLLETSAYIQHGVTSVYMHSIAVAYYSFRIAKLLGISDRPDELIRGALLHDYFLYDWHNPHGRGRLHGFCHPLIACNNATRDFNLSRREQDIIKKHMFPLTGVPPIYKESLLVCIVDKICAVYECIGEHYTLKEYISLFAAEQKVLDS